MPTELRTFEVEPTGPIEGSVVWLHGLGASNYDFEDLVPELAAPNWRFVFPAAPELPVTINGGMVMPAWYDIISLADPPLREDEGSVRSSAECVAQLIDREVARGVPAHKIIVMGFSQGGALALHVGTRYPARLAGIAVLSGYLLLPGKLQEERAPANTQTPILLCHGEFDPVVPLPLGQAALRSLLELGYPAELHTFGMPHAICLPEVALLSSWLRTRLEGPPGAP